MARRRILILLVAAIGCLAFLVGVYLFAGWPWALIAGGVLGMAVAVDMIRDEIRQQ